MRRSLSLFVVLALCAGLQAVAMGPGAKEVTVTSKSPEAVEEFNKGRHLAENIRQAEAEEHFKKALSLDPSFAFAEAYLGVLTPGAEGTKHLESAVSHAKALPEAERMTIELMLADRQGNETRASELAHKLAEVAPGDWRNQFRLGDTLAGEYKWEEATAALERATTLNPEAGPAFNTLGYTYLTMGKNDKAVEAFRKYASLMPKEPNPQDSLGEALLAAGRYDEAEAAFRKSVELSPKFWPGWEGVASTKFLRGDWTAGREALAKAKAAATRPADKLTADQMLAWSYAAEGNVAEAIKMFEANEKAATTQKVDGVRVFSPLDRAILLSDTGKPADALAMATKALDNPENAKLAGATQNNLRRFALVVRIDAESRLSKATEAKSTLALVEAEGKKFPTNAELQSLVHHAQGAEAMSRGDAKAAAQHFAQCNETDFYCRMQLVKAHEKAGNAPAAATERSRILAANRRTGDYLYIRSKLSEKPQSKS